MTTPTLPAVASVEGIEAALRRSGVLGAQEVADVALEDSYATILSHIFRLRITYANPSASIAGRDAPTSLILKAGLPEREGGPWKGGQREVAFYTDVAPAMPDVTPLCHDAHWDPATGAWHLLLEDLTDSHMVATRWPLPPTAQQCEGIIRARARLHARWWDDARLGLSVGTRQDAATVQQTTRSLEDLFPQFVDRLGDTLSTARRVLYERLIAAAPRLLARLCAHRHVTIVHGDAHFWNCFVPRPGVAGDVRFFDWDAWRIGIGSDDLAYMMAIHWYPELRRSRENHLLDSYHDELVAQGVVGYDRAALQDDYRLSVLWQTTKPIWQESSKIPPLVWWNNFERIHLAVEDLDCRELLDAG